MNKLYYLGTNGNDLLAVVVDGKVYCCDEHYMRDEYYQQHLSELKNWEDDGVREAAAVGYLRWIAEFNNSEELSSDWEPYCLPFDASELGDDNYEIVAEMEIA